MWLQSLVEIGHAYTGVDDGGYNKKDCDDSKTGQTLTDRKVILGVAFLIHPGEFEDEVCKAAEVEENGDHHSNLVFASSPESCHEQNEDSDRNRCNGQSIFGIGYSCDNDEKLYCEAEEEEEIELQEGDVNLMRSVSSQPRLEDELTWNVKNRRFMRRSALMCL